MCEFFSFVTEPEHHGGRRFYFDWKYRKNHLSEECDSHSMICAHYRLDEDNCNKYEFNPFTKEFDADNHSAIDDRVQAEEWVNNLDFKRIVEPLIVKPVINPFELPKVEEVTPEQIDLLQKWSSVWHSIPHSVYDSVSYFIRTSAIYVVWNSVFDSVNVSVRSPVWDSIRNSSWAYVSSFFDIKYDYDFSPVVRLWEAGLVPSFDGKTWRLHSGKKAEIVYELKQ